MSEATAENIGLVANGDDVEMAGAPVYEKVGYIRAICMPDPFVVVTTEGIMHGERGDYLAEAILSDGGPGERWIIKASRFSATYRLVGHDTAPPCKDPRCIIHGQHEALVAADDEVGA